MPGDESSEVKFVGPATAEALSDASFDAEDIRAKTVSFRMLLDAGVNPGVAARIRREHSLSWSFQSEDAEDLRRRSSQVRGLGDDERAWVAASSGDWEERTRAREDDEKGADADAESAWVAAATGEGTAAADGSGDPVAAESAWRERSRPTPVEEVEAVSAADARELAEAGITSARSLSVADPTEVAEALERDPEAVDELRRAAERHVE